MSRRIPPIRLSTIVPTMLALALGSGWVWREAVHAQERAGLLASATIGVDEIPMSIAKDKGEPVGKIGIYLQGATETCSSMVAGRFIIDPGKSPHAPHVHPDEEIMVVESGHGEIFCDGKTTEVGPGSVMFTEPNVSHNINNTGDQPLTFYFVKWVPRKAQ